MRSRLVWCSRKRGIVEMELLLGTFVKGGMLDRMDRAELEEYDRVRLISHSSSASCLTIRRCSF